jgi:hypothetical protein
MAPIRFFCIWNYCYQFSFLNRIWRAKSDKENHLATRGGAYVIFYYQKSIYQFLFDSHSHFDPLNGRESLEESNGGGKNPTVIRG